MSRSREQGPDKTETGIGGTTDWAIAIKASTSWIKTEGRNKRRGNFQRSTVESEATSYPCETATRRLWRFGASHRAAAGVVIGRRWSRQAFHGRAGQGWLVRGICAVSRAPCAMVAWEWLVLCIQWKEGWLNNPPRRNPQQQSRCSKASLDLPARQLPPAMKIRDARCIHPRRRRLDVMPPTWLAASFGDAWILAVPGW